MRILLIGDVVGRPGRRIVQLAIRGLRIKEGLDLVVVNAENAAGGSGIAPEMWVKTGSPRSDCLFPQNGRLFPVRSPILLKYGTNARRNKYWFLLPNVEVPWGSGVSISRLSAMKTCQLSNLIHSRASS